MVSTLCVGFSGSNSTRLLKHGMAGHMVEIVALSWIAKPCGRSSRNLSLSKPPDRGSCPSDGPPVRMTSPARPIARRNRMILITHLSKVKPEVVDHRVHQGRQRTLGESVPDARAHTAYSGSPSSPGDRSSPVTSNHPAAGSK